MSTYRISRHRYALDTAKTAMAVQAFGNYIQIVKASSLIAVIGVEMEGDNLKTEGALELRNRDYIRVPDPFSKVYLTWDAQPGAWVEIVFITQDPAPEEFEYVTQERGTIDSIASTVKVTEEPRASFATGQQTVTTAGVLIAPANAGRKEIAVTNASLTTDMYVLSAAGTANGQYVPPMATLTLPVTADVYGYTVSGTALATFVEV